MEVADCAIRGLLNPDLNEQYILERIGLSEHRMRQDLENGRRTSFNHFYSNYMLFCERPGARAQHEYAPRVVVEDPRGVPEEGDPTVAR